MHNLGLNAILDQQAKLIKTQQQIATGKRVLNPSDDPSAVASSININQSIKRTEQFQENINTARSRQNLEEQTLAGTRACDSGKQDVVDERRQAIHCQ
jgi:flagellar hook-associated protein 3 FlgL